MICKGLFYISNTSAWKNTTSFSEQLHFSKSFIFQEKKTSPVIQYNAIKVPESGMQYNNEHMSSPFQNFNCMPYSSSACALLWHKKKHVQLNMYFIDFLTHMKVRHTSLPFHSLPLPIAVGTPSLAWKFGELVCEWGFEDSGIRR